MKKVVQNVIQESIYNLNDYAFKLDINNVDCELKSKLNNHADNQIMFINNVSLLANLVMDEVIMCLMQMIHSLVIFVLSIKKWKLWEQFYQNVPLCENNCKYNGMQQRD